MEICRTSMRRKGRSSVLMPMANKIKLSNHLLPVLILQKNNPIQFIVSPKVWMMLLVIFLFGFQPGGRNIHTSEAVLRLPLTEKKLIMAHCMPNIIRYKGHPFEDSCNPLYYSPDSSSTASLGGLTQVNVIADSYLKEKSLDEAVEFEMRAAMATGIDGFQFYYTLGNDSWDEIITAYFRVADALKFDFKFTLCISHPSGSDERGRIKAFAKRINAIMATVGKNNTHWMRTPDGRLVIYTWYGDTLADIPAELNNFPEQYYIANAYAQLEEAVQEKFACIISINEQISKEKLNRYLDYFPAVWLWTLPYTNNYIGKMVAQQCKERHRVFTGSAFPDFYTSKLLKRGTWDMYHTAGAAAKAGIKKAERKYIATGLSYNFRQQLAFGIEQQVPIMNVITWNDYPEGHHLAPEVNHNDGFTILLNNFRSQWKKEANPYEGKDVLVAFYKKYKSSIQPSPFNLPVIEIEQKGIDPAVEDSVEVVSILKEGGVLLVNGMGKRVGAGLQVTRFVSQPGPIIIALQRNNHMVDSLHCPEWITDQPYRTDRLTYSYSNLTKNFYSKLFGEFPLLQSTEYDKEAKANNLRFYQSK